jgi:hypothetical protein
MMPTGEYINQNLEKKSNFFIKNGISEFIELLFYLIVAFILVYFIPVRLNRLLFLLVLPIVWFSKKDYLWIAFFFILMEMPGGLFSGGLRDDSYRLPVYTLAPGISFALHELYIMVILAKSIFVKRIASGYSPPFFRKELKLLLWLFLALILISPLSGMSMDSMSNVFKLSVSLTLFYSVFRLINSEENFIKFLKIMFPFAFIALALQIYGLINGEQLIALVKPGVKVAQGSYNIAGNNNSSIRPIEMAHAMFITFTGSLFLLISKRHNLARQYLVFVNLISFLVILMTGTRSWFIAFCIGYLAFFFLAGKKTPKLILNSLGIVIIVLLLIWGITIINSQVRNAFSRIATVEQVLGGDITGGGTISRYDVRAPRVMEGFYSSTIILGAGFSNHFYEYADGHVGYHNILLNAGIAGSFLFLYFTIIVLRRPFSISRKFKNINKPVLKISIIPLVIMLIINTGTQTIGFTPDGVNRIILMIFTLLTIDISLKTCLKDMIQKTNER